MNHSRLAVVVLGPLPIVAASLVITNWWRPGGRSVVSGNHILHADEPRTPPASPIAGDLACPSAGKRTQDPPVAIARPATSPDAVEQAILNDYVLGREMPYPSTGPTDYRTQPLSFAERVRLRLWIDQGAVGESCAACSEPVAEVDGGAPDSGASDAGDGGLPVPSDAGTD